MAAPSGLVSLDQALREDVGQQPFHCRPLCETQPGIVPNHSNPETTSCPTSQVIFLAHLDSLRKRCVTPLDDTPTGAWLLYFGE